MMFEYAKEGDRVWHIRNGWGTITRISTECDYYPIEVMFASQRTNAYTVEGKSFRTDINPTLFWDEVKIEVPDQPARMIASAKMEM